MLLDAQFLPVRSAADVGPDSQFIYLAHIARRIGMRKVPRDSITIIRDGPTCRRIGKALAEAFRGDLPDWDVAPVLIVRVGDFYLVDDQRSRDGADAYWEVVVYDHNWRRVISYGAGA